MGLQIVSHLLGTPEALSLPVDKHESVSHSVFLVEVYYRQVINVPLVHPVKSCLEPRTIVYRRL